MMQTIPKEESGIEVKLAVKPALLVSTPNNNNNKEIKMAEVDTSLLAAQHSEIVKEGLKGDYTTLSAIKDARHDVGDMVGREGDRAATQLATHNSSVDDRFFTVARDTADLKAQVIHTLYAVDAAADRSAKDSQIAILQNTIEGQKNTQFLSEKIGGEGDRTRALINDLKYNDLNRQLVERSAELVDERMHARHWRGNWDQGQFQALQSNMASQLAAVNSQLAETRQGMVNFGTMAGVGQTSTANNVR